MSRHVPKFGRDRTLKRPEGRALKQGFMERIAALPYLLGVGVCSLTLTLNLHAQTPALNGVVATRLEPAKSCLLNLLGEKLAGPVELWTSFRAHAFPEPALTSVADGNSGFQYRVYVPSDFRRGIGAVRLGTTNGVSTLQLVMLDDLMTVHKSSSNSTLQTAQELTLPVAVEGQGTELGFDYFKVAGQQGARISAEVVAQRVGSSFDPVIRLLDGDGRELLYCDDSPGLQGDARFTFQFPKDGAFFIELRDTRYQGGARHRYHLRVGDFPLEPIPFLPVVHPLGAPVSAPLPISLEKEPNDALGDATLFQVPAQISGSFAKDKDRDYFRFEAKAGERIQFAGRSRSIGYPCDLFMQVWTSDGKLVAEANVTGPNDASLTNTFTEARSYYLLVEELNRNGGADMQYQVDVTPLEPGFGLSVDVDKLDVPAGGTADLKVSVVRRDYDGPITLRLAGLHPGITVSNNLIAAKSNSVDLKITMPADQRIGAVIPFTVLGEAKIGERTVEARASQMSALRRLFPLMLYPPEPLEGILMMGVKGPKS